MIVEKRLHWLVEDYVISCYNHPARGDYNTEALIFQNGESAIFYVSGEKKKENVFALIITWAIILK